MTPVLMDTHALLWMLDKNPKLGPKTRKLADESRAGDCLLISSISFWEIAILQQRNRLRLAVPTDTLRRNVLDLGVGEVSLTGEIGIEAAALAELHADPADRFIVATALKHGAILATADRQILNWTGTLARHDART